MSASVAGPSAAYNGRKIGKVNRTFLNNTVIAALGGNRRREREAAASAASAATAAHETCEMQFKSCNIYPQLFPVFFVLEKIGLVVNGATIIVFLW